MVKPSKGVLSIAAIAALGVLSACGTSSSPGSSSSSGGGGIANCHGTITVATDLPLTGGDATDGPFPQLAAELAVTQANANHLLGGCTLKYVSKDDSTVLKNGHDPAQGAANITALASDGTVMGVVGPFNSNVALAEIPVASQNHLALISPSNTNPCLTAVVAVCSDPTIKIDTASLYPGAHSYFRVIASDIQQGEIDAYVAAKVLNANKVYVIDDQEAYGRGLALIFTKAYTTTDGGTVVGSASLPGSTTTFATQISNAQADGAKAIFFGGTSGNGCGLVRRDMGKAGLNIPLLGGDGCQDTKFITDANSGANTSEAVGSFATSAPDVTKLSSSATFFSQYAIGVCEQARALQRRHQGALHGVRLRCHEHPAAGDSFGARCQRRPAALQHHGFPGRRGRSAAPDVLRRCARSHDLRHQRGHDQHRVHPVQGCEWQLDG